jgi:hypothetical protein
MGDRVVERWHRRKMNLDRVKGWIAWMPDAEIMGRTEYMFICVLAGSGDVNSQLDADR